MLDMMKLLIATNNQGKVLEYQELLRGLPFELVTLAQAGVTNVVDETGVTMRQNAILKASGYAALSHLLTIADDSGLEVDALDGAPGIMSARYAGPKANDADRVNYLLTKLKNVPEDKRTARFRCVIAIATAKGKIFTRTATCDGVITLAPRGEQGFGYDPIFHFPKYGKTMAEVPMSLKNNISHRGKAARKARLVLKQLAE
jgi:XTP/dITP diphosphohydrolase